MYQIIYIDIDEEITSVIDKLRKTRTKQVFLSVPSRALILQSIVSLKLLRKEADKLERNIVMVTGDPKERKLSEKADIETKETLEGLDTEGEMKESVVPRIEEKGIIEKKSRGRGKKASRKSTEEIGSTDFYDVNGDSISKPSWDKVEIPSSPKRMMVEVSRETPRPEVRPRMIEQETEEDDFSEDDDLVPVLGEKEDLVDDFFQGKGSERTKPDKMEKAPSLKKNIPVSKRIRKVVWAIIILAVILFGVAAAYLFVPRAEVKLLLRDSSLEKDLEIKGSSGREGIDFGSRTIPTRLIEKEESYSFSYPVTGKSEGQGQKARGSVTIYNEYSPAPQPLVATTRLITPDKKIFRLVKGVTVPGTSVVGGKTEPGAIEVEVVADEGGEEYNIDPSSFKIPGFEGSPKYEKFYAKSTSKMTGGSSSGSSGGSAAVTQTDVAMAKGKAEDEAKSRISDDLKSGLAPQEVFLANVSEVTINESTPLSRIGDTVEKLEYRVTIKIKSIVFSSDDVKKIFIKEFNLDNQADRINDIELDYGAVNGDLETGSETIKVHGKISLSQDVDTEKLKEDIAGKEGGEIQEIIKKYPQIEEMEIDVKPAIIFKKIPQIKSRIEVIIL